MRLRPSDFQLRAPGKTWREKPGCLARQKHVAVVVRGATQLAGRLRVVNDKECKWSLRASRNSDEACNPGSKRQSVCTPARRLARGPPSVDQSKDQWPGSQAARRPEVALPDSEPRAQPAEPLTKFAAFKSDSSVRAQPAQSPRSFCSAPKCVLGHLNGKQVIAPPRPLRASGLERDESKPVYSERYQSDWWDVAFEIGRAPFDSKFCALRNALSESLAPIYRHLIRGSAAAVRGGSAAGQESVSSMGFETASSLVQLGAFSAELGDLLLSYVEDVPKSVAPAIAAGPELAGSSGSLGPLGVIAGVAFAMVARSAFSARSKWFQFLD